MAQSKPSRTPRVLLTIVALFTGITPYIADFNDTHVYNPTWPGHARFHNGQTMSMGVFLGLTTLWKTWWDDRDRLLTASVLASAYYVTMLSAWYYPGATAFDPPQDFAVSFPHLFFVVPILGMVGSAYWLENKNVGVAGRKGKKM